MEQKELEPKLATLEITSLLVEWSDGNQAALDALMPLVHAELQKLAFLYAS